MEANLIIYNDDLQLNIKFSVFKEAKDFFDQHVKKFDAIQIYLNGKLSYAEYNGMEAFKKYLQYEKRG